MFTEEDGQIINNEDREQETIRKISKINLNKKKCYNLLNFVNFNL